MGSLPKFVIIGAMKAATTTLYEQLASQKGIYLPKLKEPNYFSDNKQFFRGIDWYSSLFDAANEQDLLGEASTHYTKLPTYPDTIFRLKQELITPKFIYIMRHPIDRLISQYVHEWSEGRISMDIDQAVFKHPELISYSKYAYQITPYIKEFGKNNVLPIFFENLKNQPQYELERVCDFINYKNVPKWNDGLTSNNISKERVRKFPLYSLLIESRLARFLRHALVPQSFRDKVKKQLQMRERPILNKQSYNYLVNEFNKDLMKLSDLINVEINCENYNDVVTNNKINWNEK